MTYTYRSLRKFYFRTLESSTRIYALIDPNPIPILSNSRGKVIMADTLPGVVNGTLTSGRSIFINLGGSYTSTFETSFSYSDEAFRSFLQSRRNSMDDFYMGYMVNPFAGTGTDEMEEYRVCFNGENGLVFEQPENYSIITKLSLVNLGLHYSYSEDSD